MPALVLALLITSGPSWPGFHGLGKRGYARTANPPVVLREDRTLAWRTEIPGRGHSSPVLDGDRLYVTTAYESSALRGLLERGNVALAVLLCLLGGLLGVLFPSRLRKPFRAFVAAVCLGGLASVVLFGERTLDLASPDAATWLAVTGATLGCVILVSCTAERVGLLRPALGLGALGLCAAAWLVHPQRDLLLEPASKVGMAGAVLLAACALFGLSLLMPPRQRYEEHQGQTEDLGVRRTRFSALLSGFVLGLLPAFFLAVRAAGWSPQDISLRPTPSWWLVGLFLVVTASSFAFLSSKRKPVLPKRFDLLFAIVAALTAALLFVQYNVILPRRSFVHAIVCLDARNGRIRWIAEPLRGRDPCVRRPNAAATPTPVSDGSSVYAYFGNVGFAAVNRFGEKDWVKRNLPFRSAFGPGPSPLYMPGALVLVSDSERPEEGEKGIHPYLVALRTFNGEEIWRVQRPWGSDAHACYATPFLYTEGVRATVVVQGWDDVRGYDLETGKEKWVYPFKHGGRHLVAAVTGSEDLLFVSGYREIRALSIRKLESGEDPLVWRCEVRGEKSATPVCAQGLLFGVTESGRAYCIDAKTGKLLWRKRLRGTYFASVVAAADRVYFTSRNGIVSVVRCARTFSLLGRSELNEQVYATPAPVGRSLYVRTEKAVLCFRSR